MWFKLQSRRNNHIIIVLINKLGLAWLFGCMLFLTATMRLEASHDTTLSRAFVLLQSKLRLLWWLTPGSHSNDVAGCHILRHSSICVTLVWSFLFFNPGKWEHLTLLWCKIEVS